MNPLKVLVVDDEPGIRLGINRVLRNFSVKYPYLDEDFTFESILAETGEEAIAILDSQPIDIVLLDNKLPGITGMDVLEYINSKQFDTAVMMITSFASLDVAIKATNRGAYDFVPKPFTPAELQAAVEKITKYIYLRRMTRKMQVEGKQIRFQFLSVLSHELKSPLNAIEGYLRIMQDQQAGSNLGDYRQMIDRSLERIKGMRGLIMDMLDLTKIESGVKTRKMENVDISDIARISVNTFEPLAIQKNVNIHLNVADSLFVKADASEMEIILNNLISNAVKYNNDNGDVYVDISNNDNRLRMRIQDTGIGMTEEDSALLFKEFVRIKNNQTRNINGSGLGLSIVKKLTDMYGGDIKVNSKPGEGTVFVVEIPVNE